MRLRGFDGCCRLAALAFPPLVAAGCLSLQLPEGFLEISRGRSEYKATTPDDAVLWVREFSDEHRGSLAFWCEALKKDFTGNRGYTLLGEEAIHDGDRNDGVALLYGATVQGISHRYLVALFVIDGWWSNTIRVAEFVAPEEVFTARVEGMKTAIRTLE